MDTQEDYYAAGFRDKIAAWYHHAPKPITNAGSSVKDYFKRYLDLLDGKITEEDFKKINESFIKADTKQPDLPGFSDLFKESSYKQAGILSALSRLKNMKPLRLSQYNMAPTGGQKAIHKALNFASPQAAKKYQRHLEFKPQSYRNHVGQTTTKAYDLPIVDRILDLEETGRFGPLMSKVQGGLKNYYGTQRKLLNSPAAGLYARKLSK